VFAIPFVIITFVTRGHPAAAMRQSMVEGQLSQVPGRSAWQRALRRGLTARQRLIFYGGFVVLLVAISLLIALLQN
jgi:hypothetical protein